MSESTPRQPPGHGRIRDLFLRLLGLIFLDAFVSIFVQVDVLIGHQGLMPAALHLTNLTSAGFWAAPTVFWLDCSDRALHAAALLGAGLSFGLILNVAPR